MRFLLDENSLTAIREEHDDKYYGRANAAGESRLLYNIKVLLNNNGFDLVKKRMWKDGHLVDDLQQYLRTRWERSSTPHVMIYSQFFAIRGANDDWNRNGEVTLALDADVFYSQEDCGDRLREIAAQSRIIEWVGEE